MTSLEQLLSRLHALNITITVESDHLRYQAPKGMMTEELRVELMAHKALLLEHFRSIQRPANSLRPMPRDREIRASWAQQRLWILDQVELGNSAYNIVRVNDIHGPLDLSALEASFNALIGRHEMLRTTFDFREGNLIQVIQPRHELRLNVIDLRDLVSDELESAIEIRISQEANHAFDLRVGPLLRVSILQHDDQGYVLILVMHHIVSDGWSMGLLNHELGRLYCAFKEGTAPDFEKLPVQYADYAIWQREQLQGEVLEHQIRYWRTQLEALTTVELPTDYPRPSMQTYRGQRASLLLPSELGESLRALNQRTKTTLFMTLLAAFNVLLFGYSGQEDITVGTPIAGRYLVETEKLIGFFVNTLVLRNDLSGNPGFGELLERIKRVCLEAYDHAELPFETLVEGLSPAPDLSRNPLFQILFAVQNVPDESLQLIGTGVRRRDIDRYTAQFDLSWFCRETPEGILITCEFNTDLFGLPRVRRMLEHFQTLLADAASHPDKRISELEILTPAERTQLLETWNQNRVLPLESRCIHHLFEDQARQTPDRVAVEFGNESITYAELDERANQLAIFLQEKGVEPGSKIGIMVERSLGAMIGVLGILKAGCAYVPLDPSYPKDRLRLMLSDAHAELLLTQESLSEMIPDFRGPTILLDQDWPLIAQKSSSQPSSPVTHEDLAYVIYTSGSTGRPKGIAMPHRSLINLIAWQTQHPAFPLSRRTLQFSSLSFDVSFQEIFSTWCSGGTLVLIQDDVRRDSSQLWQYIADSGIERLFLPFVALEALAVQAIEMKERVASCRLQEIITAGEQLRITAELRDLFRSMPGCTLFNQYGPAETHVVTEYQLEDLVDEWPTFPPIGKPISNVEIYILDQYLNLVPIGVPGNLYISGEALADGYLNQPELTAERFKSSPFSDHPESHLYMTGDQAVFGEDGNVHFLGRLDDQVKIRGYRVEPGEVETLLEQHEDIQQAVVIAHGESRIDKRLAAYVIPAPGNLPESMRLISYLRTMIPEYMVPASITVLDKFPLTPSGKINRKALPLPDMTRSNLHAVCAPPETHWQSILTTIWKEILGVDLVGIHDNFFDLGGHSLAGVQLLSRIHSVSRKRIPLIELFQAPTIAEFAALLNQQHSITDNNSLVLLRPGGEHPALYLIHPGGGHLHAYYFLVRDFSDSRPIYGLQARGLDGISPPSIKVEQMARHYIQEILQNQPTGPFHLCGLSMGGMIAFEMARQLRESGHSVGAIIMIDSVYPRSKTTETLERPSRASQIKRGLVKTSSLVRSSVTRDWQFLRQSPSMQLTLSYVIRRIRHHWAWQIRKRWQRHFNPPDPVNATDWNPEKRVRVACNQAYTSYDPQFYEGTIVFIRAENASRPNAYQFWQAFVGGMQLLTAPGTHKGILGPENTKELAKTIDEVLERIGR